MLEQITERIKSLFERFRVVFWYDKTGENREIFDNIKIEGVQKVEIKNNEFALKYRILRLESDLMFLLYKAGPKPDVNENWLLDVELASAVFKADEIAMWLDELGLPTKLNNTISQHKNFFKSQSRVAKLKEQINSNMTADEIKFQMLAVCTKNQGGFNSIVEGLLSEFINERDTSMRLIESTCLTDFFWSQLKSSYGYSSAEPNIEDFALSLFQSAFNHDIGNKQQLNQEAVVLLNNWKNNRIHKESFEKLSKKIYNDLEIEKKIENLELRQLVKTDLFEQIDQQIILKLIDGTVNQTLDWLEVTKCIKEREQCFWYERYDDIYQAIWYATEFQLALTESQLELANPKEGVTRYVSTWFKLDQYYRKYIFHMSKKGQSNLLSTLSEKVENLYTNNFLLALNNKWQDKISQLTNWEIPNYPSQINFYDEQVAEFRRKNQKVVVIISDAFRYEIAEECLHQILALDRFEAELKPMISVLPSYTQLGMAALLPNKNLEIDSKGKVKSFGESSQGLPAREKLLSKGHTGDRVKALKFAEISKMNTDKCKEIFRDHETIYIYHNHIDATGEKPDLEPTVFNIVEESIQELTKLVRKLASANFTNMLLTADHGFLFQYRQIDESDFLVSEPKGKEILVKNRRYVIGKDLEESQGMKKFTATQLSLKGQLDVLIPNSINRLRVKGAGIRFVHGGATLQETIIPVITVQKKRESDVSQVDVKIIVTGRNVISTNQVAVTFYQEQPISEKNQPRELVAGIYSADGSLISDEHKLKFDLTSDSARGREILQKFLISSIADSFSKQEVYLKLRERIGNTSKYKDYTSISYQLRRGIDADFDL